MSPRGQVERGQPLLHVANEECGEKARVAHRLRANSDPHVFGLDVDGGAQDNVHAAGLEVAEGLAQFLRVDGGERDGLARRTVSRKHGVLAREHGARHAGIERARPGHAQQADTERVQRDLRSLRLVQLKRDGQQHRLAMRKVVLLHKLACHAQNQGGERQRRNSALAPLQVVELGGGVADNLA